jgi:hypothetical protein
MAHQREDAHFPPFQFFPDKFFEIKKMVVFDARDFFVHENCQSHQILDIVT